MTWMTVPMASVAALRRLSETMPCYLGQNWHTRFWQFGYASLVALVATVMAASRQMHTSHSDWSVFLLPGLSLGFCGLAVHQLDRDRVGWMAAATLVPCAFVGSIVPTIIIAAVYAALLLWFPDHAGIRAETDRFSVRTATYDRTENHARHNTSARYNTRVSAGILAVTGLLMMGVTETGLSPVGGKSTPLFGTTMTSGAALGVMTTVLFMTVVAIALTFRKGFVSSDNMFRSAALGVFTLAATSVNISAVQAAWLVADCVPGNSTIPRPMLSLPFISSGMVAAFSIWVFQQSPPVELRTRAIAAHAFVIVFGLAEIAGQWFHTLFIVFNASATYPLVLACHYMVVDGLVQHMYPKHVRSATDQRCLYAAYALGAIVASWTGTILTLYFDIRGPHSPVGCNFYYYPHLVAAARCIIPWFGIACAYAFIPNLGIR